MKRKKLLLLLGSVCLALVLVVPFVGACAAPTAPAEAEAEYRWKLGSAEAEGGWGMIYGHWFEELIEERSGGRIEVTVYPKGTLGTGAHIAELCRNGVLEMSSTGPMSCGPFVTATNIFYLHYKMPGDFNQLLEILNKGEFFEVMKREYAEGGFELIDFTSSGFSAWTSNKPLRTLEDFKGLKFRVMMSPMLVAAFEAYGANPTPMDYGEVYSGLQMGVIEGQENPLNSIHYMAFYEVQDYITMSYHFPFINNLVANPEFMESLPEDIKEMFYEAHWETAVWSTTEWQEEFNAEMLALILEKRPAVTYYELTPEEREPFREAAKGVRPLFLTEEIGGKNAAEVLAAYEANIKRVVGE